MLGPNVANEVAKVAFGRCDGCAGPEVASFSLPQTGIPGSPARAPGSARAAGPPRRDVRGRSEGPSGEPGAPRGHPEHGKRFRHFWSGKQGPRRPPWSAPSQDHPERHSGTSVPKPAGQRGGLPRRDDHGRGRRPGPAQTPSSRSAARGRLRRLLLARGAAGGVTRSRVPRPWSRELGQTHLFLRVDCQRLIAKGEREKSCPFICKWKSDEAGASLHQRFHSQSGGFQSVARLTLGGRQALAARGPVLRPRVLPRQPRARAPAGPGRPLSVESADVSGTHTGRGLSPSVSPRRLGGALLPASGARPAMPNSWPGLTRVCKPSSPSRRPREILRQ